MLFRGGRREADVLLAEFDAVGEGVEDILIAASSCDISDMLFSCLTEVICACKYFSREPAVQIYELGSGIEFSVSKDCVVRRCVCGAETRQVRTISSKESKVVISVLVNDSLYLAGKRKVCDSKLWS